MIKIWINKENGVPPTSDDMLIFNLLNKNKRSNISTDIERLWREFGKKDISKLVEDFLIIGLSIYAVDKRISRSLAYDNWTRSIQLNIPVLELEKWNDVKDSFENTLSFLSGDQWELNFYKTHYRFRADKLKKNPLYNPSSYDSVALFSGGLDSFAGALTLLNQKKNPFFVGFKEYNLLVNRQQMLIDEIRNHYNSQNFSFKNFNVVPKKPMNTKYQDKFYTENTSRSRSLLFIVGAVAVASTIGKDVKVYVPENGFIGVNVPLTQSRNGSCSTRTTHPNFINSLNEILNRVGIQNTIENFYSYNTKGEIVEEHKENPIFKKLYRYTISCSHPCQSRYDKVNPPKNCGYCYPCLIRRASLNWNGFTDDDYNPLYNINIDFIFNNTGFNSKSSDLRALLYSIRRFIDSKDDQVKMKTLLIKPGVLQFEELNKYEMVYRKTMIELIEMIRYFDNKSDDKTRTLANYIGLD